MDSRVIAAFSVGALAGAAAALLLSPGSGEENREGLRDCVEGLIDDLKREKAAAAAALRGLQDGYRKAAERH